MRKPNALSTAVVFALALALGACEADSPTAPTQGPAPPPPTNVTPAVWVLTINASPDTFSVEEIAETGVNTATVTVTARRASNGQLPPVGSTVFVTASGGTLSNVGGTSTGNALPFAFDSSGRAVGILTVPSQEASIVLQAQLEGTVVQTVVRVFGEEEVIPLFIESVSPSSGPPSGGTRVRIEGTGFDPPVRVTFGGIPATVVSSSSNVIVVETPSINLPVGQVSTVAVAVSINVNEEDEPQSTDVLTNAFTYARDGQVQVPSIINLTPTSGPNEGGTQVTIFGEGFADQVQVFFGSAALIEAPVLEVTPTRIVVQTPSATGPNAVNQNAVVNVRVVNTVTGLFTERANAFQYGGGPSDSLFISSVIGSEGFYYGGLNVTIFGQGFDEPVAVEFGAHAQQVISVSGTEIIARSVPVEIVNCNRPSGPYRVVNIETAEVADSSLTFTYRPVEPVIGGVNPSEVTIDVETRAIIGNDTVTVSGAGFDQPRVFFGDDPGSNVTITTLDPAHDSRYGIGSQLTVRVPSFLGDFDTDDCTVGDSTGTRLVPTRVDVRVLNVPTGCDDTLARAFTYVPSDQSCMIESDGGGGGLEADFTFEVNNLTVSFTDTSTGEPNSWLWAFGDGGTSTQQNPTHTYPPVEATYSVTLTVSDGSTTSTTSQQVTVTPLGL